MDDFASAAMVRLLLRAMQAEGLEAPRPLPDGARVPLALKQQVVGGIVAAGGLKGLLRLARQVRYIEGEPVHRALVAARDPHDFLARWQRLERYVHASHRVEAVAVQAEALTLAHQARTAADAPPLAAESTAVLGVWIGALEAIGTRGLEVEVGGRRLHGPEGGVANPSGAASAGSSAVWHLRWAPRPAVEPAASGAHASRSAPVPPPDPLGERLPWGEPGSSVARWLARDPGGPTHVRDAALALGVAPRTLQRRLAAQGLSFGALQGEVRVRLAATWLTQSTHGLAEIGYLCGYADQAHFTREFTRRAGLPPARYRASAQVAGRPVVAAS